MAGFLRALLNAGMPSEDVGLPRQAQQLVLKYAAKLAPAARELLQADVLEAARPTSTEPDCRADGDKALNNIWAK